MSEAKGRCLFDKSKECPVRAVTELEDLLNLGKVYCPICPIRQKMTEEI
ncbi:MAG: hypothetical protein JSV29_04985 [Candidatus Bathyarchaeota archaeon]|jgi:hypothetical protein|nr:MAG: hypothetical protein JSV29_04985 [Candidatus Bathyarchaeota archaeon]